MSIKFIIANDDYEATFGQVEENQMFIDSHGYLCQKVDEDWYNVIADAHGEPLSDRRDAIGSDKISKILPKVTKIEF